MAIRLEVRGLEKTYGKIRALRIESLEIESKIIAIIGPNGSGKTTFLTIAAGLSYPSKGHLEINGLIPYKEREKALKEISFLFEKPKLPLPVKVRDVVGLVRELGDSDGVEQFINVMNMGMLMDRNLYDLSMGEAQLVGLLTALYMKSSVVILDEPFAHLDVRRGGILAGILKDREACIYTTHSPWDAESLADYIIVLDDGEIRWSGSRSELYKGNIIEVYIEPGNGLQYIKSEDSGIRLLTCHGYICLVQVEDFDSLERLYKRGDINGFKKAGVRKIYANALGND
ncbi:MAG: ATP-binding cassette domain-containing protein [Aeropyrum sp.]|nr:ATP-binding cassette domain-containing protein [Aeropyrum sp.]MCE4616691.1 ATP-binding cassette domain-containing protein [Aeropyrum sp.]